MLKFLKPKFLLKIAWFGFGLAGLVIVSQKYFPHLWPNLKDSSLIKGVQTGLIQSQPDNFSSNPNASPKLSLEDIKTLDPQQASQVIAKVVSQEIVKVLETTTEEVKEFPARQVRKIKIGACEELLEEDICSVASQLDCQ